MLTGKYMELYNRLRLEIPAERLIHDDLRTFAYGTDASVYRLIPRLIVRVESEAEVILTLKHCRDLALPVTFRAAGTSLSGQALTDSVMILMGTEGWRDYAISEDAGEIRLGAGILGAQANQYLSPYNRKIGPDPASVNSAKIGGIVANNACGMASGVIHNSMYTLKHMRIIFSDGTVLDTGDPESRRAFLRDKQEMVERVSALAARVKGDSAMTAKIREKYSIKNTCGYSVNALTDFDDPVDIIQHLMVGSEGTLGFISQVTFMTTYEAPRKATALMLFPTMARACEAVLLLKKCSVSAAELMDRVALRSVETKPGMPPHIRTLDDEAAALLVETRADDDAALQRQVDEIVAAFASFPLAHAVEFTTDAARIEALWNVRKGIFPSACSARKMGTSVIIEDIAVPIRHLENTLSDVQALFRKYEYESPVIWGHVFDGNVHFVLTPDLTDPEEVALYKKFMDEVVDLVVDRYNGSLKAEHGTGRNMAPFVEREWGPEIYAVMREIKAVFDPDGLINPDVIINDDPEGHLRNFKGMPVAHPLVDTCIECGFCERNCMSHDLTLSARQRIVLYREMTRLARSGADPTRLAALRRQFDYYGDQTCAADGLCALSCPVEIDTGRLIKDLRHAGLSATASRVAGAIGDHMDTVTTLTRWGLKVADRIHAVVGTDRMSQWARSLRKLSGDRLPLWTAWMPRNAEAISCMPVRRESRLRVVYFPACITRSMGPARYDDEQVALTRKTESLLRKAGYEIIYPKGMDRLCCGMPFASKGITDTAGKKARELGAALLAASENGEIPVLCDMSPCLYHMKETLDARLDLYEPIEFILKFLTSRLKFVKLPETVVIHTVCSAKKMGLEEKFRQLAEMCAETVVTPQITCCGFAGDRGFSYPELNAHGLRHLKEQIPESARHGYSTSRTCEIGLSRHGGISWQSVLYLVDRCTTPLD
ncbi:FAD-binding oxidoreductase [Desulfonema ishimotonii]|uniref:D-lactate dehydrogenase (cytochrome) n=1 Tax=Desulfonema ishimotonii TaxID=45657 RepID=A0A401FZM6_9BACT|nr:FAD-binding and (Fe-S)-binding domain-containing protein [Desulfonema ishimotonii]GBC62442.1 FAD-binding oxidoreductase [Desulfonema ishimotonii]